MFLREPGEREDTVVLVGSVMILPWVINCAPIGGRACVGGVERVWSRGLRRVWVKRWLGTLYAEQGAPYCARESRGKDEGRGDMVRKKKKIEREREK